MNIEWVEPSERQVQASRARRTLEQQRLKQAVLAASESLERKQHGDGYWCGELTADATLESDYILCSSGSILPAHRWNPPCIARVRDACRFRPWTPARAMAAGNLSRRARRCECHGARLWRFETRRSRSHLSGNGKGAGMAIQLGGVQACNSYTKINLSLFGLYPQEIRAQRAAGNRAAAA